MSLSAYVEEQSYEEFVQLQHIKEEMYNVRVTVEGKLASIVHPEYLEEFIRILTTAYNCNCEDAKFIAHQLDISRKDFVAIERDADLFMRIQLEEMFP